MIRIINKAARRGRATAILGFVVLMLTATVGAANAQSNNGSPANNRGPTNGNANGNGNSGGAGGGGVQLAATPELSSLALFGSAVVGAAGYAALRLRARRP